MEKLENKDSFCDGSGWPHINSGEDLEIGQNHKHDIDIQIVLNLRIEIVGSKMIEGICLIACDDDDDNDDDGAYDVFHIDSAFCAGQIDTFGSESWLGIDLVGKMEDGHRIFVELKILAEIGSLQIVDYCHV